MDFQKLYAPFHNLAQLQFKQDMATRNKAASLFCLALGRETRSSRECFERHATWGLSPGYGGNSNRYCTPIGYSGGKGRNDSLLNSTTRNVWGNGGLNNAANPSSSGTYLGSGGGAFGVFGNSSANWGPSLVSTHGGGSPPSYTSGSIGYGSGDNSFGLGGGTYGRNSGSGVAQSSTFTTPTGVYEGSYGDLYGSGSVYGDSTWRSATPELDGSGSFGYGLGNISSDVTAQSFEGYIGSYNVTIRQPNRGIAT